MFLTTYTIVHTLISLIGIFSGLVMLGGWLCGHRLEGWTKLFLITTILTSVTGFGFPFHGFTPAIGVGIISLVVLAIAVYARYSRHLLGAWRRVFVVTAVMALYFNCFVLVVMAFRRVPAVGFDVEGVVDEVRPRRRERERRERDERAEERVPV